MKQQYLFKSSKLMARTKKYKNIETEVIFMKRIIPKGKSKQVRRSVTKIINQLQDEAQSLK